MKQKSWISIVFSFASQCRDKIVLSVLCAIISVVAGLIPYSEASVAWFFQQEQYGRTIRSRNDRPLVYGDVRHEYGQHRCEWIHHRYRPNKMPFLSVIKCIPIDE